MTHRIAPILRALALAVLLAALAQPVAAAERYALVVTGAAGDRSFEQRYEDWRGRLVAVLTDRLGFGRDHVLALAEASGGDVQLASRENVRRAFASLSSRLHKDDLLLVVLVGHGTFDGTTAKFNLVGPDLTAEEWNDLFRLVQARAIVVNTTASSFPFLQALSAKGRVVIAATDSHAARYDTVFPEYFIKALETAATDVDRNDRLSIWEVFTSAVAGVRRYYEQKGLLPVEHAMLDDVGDRTGKDPEQPGVDSSVAESVYLTADPADRGADAATRELMARRDTLLGELQKLKARKPSMTDSTYLAELEQLMVELAKVSRALRAKGVTRPGP